MSGYFSYHTFNKVPEVNLCGSSGVIGTNEWPSSFQVGSGILYRHTDPTEVSEGGVFFAHPESDYDPETIKRGVKDDAWAKKIDAEFVADLFDDDPNGVFMASDDFDASGSYRCCSAWGFCGPIGT